jgi:hypothetical protein
MTGGAWVGNLAKARSVVCRATGQNLQALTMGSSSREWGDCSEPIPSLVTLEGVANKQEQQGYSTSRTTTGATLYGLYRIVPPAARREPSGEAASAVSRSIAKLR